MSKVSAISRATGNELASMEAIAKKLGSSTKFSASEAAGGLEFLSMAGFAAKGSIAALPSVLDPATAANLGLAESADVASNIMSGFGIAAGEAGSVADILATTSSRANTNVSQLGDAMKFVGLRLLTSTVGRFDISVAWTGPRAVKARFRTMATFVYDVIVDFIFS